jgi:hypothetical protein
MHSQQQRAQSLLSYPAPATAPPAPLPAAQPCPPAPTPTCPGRQDGDGIGSSLASGSLSQDSMQSPPAAAAAAPPPLGSVLLPQGNTAHPIGMSNPPSTPPRPSHAWAWDETRMAWVECSGSILGAVGSPSIPVGQMQLHSPSQGPQLMSSPKKRAKDKLMGPESNDICMCYIRALINNAHEEQAFTKCSHNIITMQISTATPILSNLFVYSVYKNKEANKFYNFLPSRQKFNQSGYPNFNIVTLCNSIFELLTMENGLTFARDDFQYSEPHQHFELTPNFETRLKIALEAHDDHLLASFKRFIDAKLLPPQKSMQHVFRSTDRQTTPKKDMKKHEKIASPPSIVIQPPMQNIFRDTDRITDAPKKTSVESKPLPQPAMKDLHRNTERTANSFQFHLETALSGRNNLPEFNFYQPFCIPQPSIKDLRKVVDKRVKEIELQRKAQLEGLLTRTPMHANQDTNLLSPADLTQRKQRTRVTATCGSSSEEPAPRRRRVKATSEFPLRRQTSCGLNLQTLQGNLGRGSLPFHPSCLSLKSLPQHHHIHPCQFCNSPKQQSLSTPDTL